MVPTQQLEGFVEIVRQGRLGAAALVLHVTQPALTARVQALEASLGTQVFERTGRGLKLTEAGRAFLPFAQRALGAIDEGRAVVGEIARGGAGRLAIGTAPAVGNYVLPGLLRRYVERWPDVRLAVRSGHSEEIADLVAGGEIDIGLVRRRDYRGLDVRLLYEDELRLVVPPGHPFDSLRQVTVARLATERLVLFDRSSSYFELTNSIFRSAGVEPRGTLELDTIDAAMQMVKAGLGVALLPGVSTAGEIERGSLRVVRLVDVPPIRRQVMAIQRPGTRPPAAPLWNFLEILDRIGEVLPSAPMADQHERPGG